MTKMTPNCPPNAEIEAIMKEIFDVDDMRELHLLRKLKATTNLMHDLVATRHKDVFLSSTRMRLLTYLVVDQRLGNEQGLLPSELSRHLGVSRNTVSALLNGLEEQGLIERRLHPTDRRQFLIQITSDGENTVRTRAPEHASFVNTMFDSLSLEERETLQSLLDKLLTHLVQRAAELGLQPAIHHMIHGTDLENSR